MSFKTIIESIFDEYNFHPPVDESKLDDLIAQVGLLPEELIELLRETDGVQLGDMVSVFSIENYGAYTFQQILEEWADPDYLEMYPNGSRLFLFAGDGMGGFFGYERLAANQFGSIYHWDHEEDELQKIKQPGLSGFIRNCEKYLD